MDSLQLPNSERRDYRTRGAPVKRSAVERGNAARNRRALALSDKARWRVTLPQQKGKKATICRNPSPPPPPRSGEGEKRRLSCLAPPLRCGEGVGGRGFERARQRRFHVVFPGAPPSRVAQIPLRCRGNGNSIDPHSLSASRPP